MFKLFFLLLKYVLIKLYDTKKRIACASCVILKIDRIAVEINNSIKKFIGIDAIMLTDKAHRDDSWSYFKEKEVFVSYIIRKATLYLRIHCLSLSFPMGRYMNYLPRGSSYLCPRKILPGAETLDVKVRRGSRYYVTAFVLVRLLMALVIVTFNRSSI